MFHYVALASALAAWCVPAPLVACNRIAVCNSSNAVALAVPVAVYPPPTIIYQAAAAQVSFAPAPAAAPAPAPVAVPAAVAAPVVAPVACSCAPVAVPYAVALAPLYATPVAVVENVVEVVKVKAKTVFQKANGDQIATAHPVLFKLTHPFAKRKG